MHFGAAVECRNCGSYLHILQLMIGSKAFKSMPWAHGLNGKRLCKRQCCGIAMKAVRIEAIIRTLGSLQAVACRYVVIRCRWETALYNALMIVIGVLVRSIE